MSKFVVGGQLFGLYAPPLAAEHQRLAALAALPLETLCTAPIMPGTLAAHLPSRAGTPRSGASCSENSLSAGSM